MRADGKRVKNAEPMYTIIPFILKHRYDAQNMITLDIPIRPMQEYKNRMRKEGRAVSHLALVLAAYLRAAAEYPSLNRFIANKRIYARNEFSAAMVVLKPGEPDGTMSKIYFDMEDDIFTVQEKIDRYIEKNRAGGENNSTDALMRRLLKVPGLMSFAVGVIKFLDKFGMLPKKLIDASPFHTSLVITNLASIRTNHIFHHCYEFGTTSVIIAMGNLREVPRQEKGSVVFDRCLPLGVVMDERICSGSYFAKAFERIKAYLEDPTLLEGRPAVVNTDM